MTAAPGECGVTSHGETTVNEGTTERAIVVAPAVSSGKRLRIIVPAHSSPWRYPFGLSRRPALGPVCVATAIGDVEGWDAEVVDENSYCPPAPTDAQGRPDHGALQATRPADAVGLYGGVTCLIPRLFEIAKFYRGLGVPTIAGGRHFVDETIEEALCEGVDFIVAGEGEEAIRELLSHLDGERGKADIRGIAYMEDGRVVRTPEREALPLDRLPKPDFSLVRHARITVFPISRIRGCPMHCEFCAVRGRPRYASAEHMMAQVASAHEKWGARLFFVTDDLFGQDRDETIRLCRMLQDYQRRVGTRFRMTVQIRLDKATDGELLQAMREAGVDRLNIGDESPIAEDLKAMNKGVNPVEMLALTREYRQAGFQVTGLFIFGYPLGDGTHFAMSAEERVRHLQAFIKKARLSELIVSLPLPLPGTELRDRLQKQNRLYPASQVGWQYYHPGFSIIRPDEPLTAEQMQRASWRIMKNFYRRKGLRAALVSVLSLPAVFLHPLSIGLRLRRWFKAWPRILWAARGGWARGPEVRPVVERD